MPSFSTNNLIIRRKNMQMQKAIIGKKVGMTQIFDEAARSSR
jgi:hypothetical protein